ncbi:MAG TPA: alpha/beta fold hydrolase [Burkholderiales bacterium]|jgi:pimeloyl-ACP methyl ester carboxylesterase
MSKSGSDPDFPVILTHGLWVPGVVMRPLAARLERAGFRCHTFSYLGAARPLQAHAERLARMARDIGPAHFVGHSLGGLVVVEALSRHLEIAAGRVVLLGTPARGCYAGRRIAAYPAGRWFLGESEHLWREGRTARWTRPEALGVVAGTLPLGCGRMFGRLPGVNDGVVCLDETEVEGMAGRAVLPVGHSAMLVSSRVAENVAHFLAEGRFSANPR